MPNKRGRPKKPSALKRLEGNRSRRDIPPDVDLHGLPECPANLGADAREHFEFIAAELGAAGVLKRLDTKLLAVFADLLAAYWRCSAADDLDGMVKAAAKVISIGGHLGIPPSERASLMAGAVKERPDEDDVRFFNAVG